MTIYFKSDVSMYTKMSVFFSLFWFLEINQFQQKKKPQKLKAWLSFTATTCWSPSAEALHAVCGKTFKCTVIDGAVKRHSSCTLKTHKRNLESRISRVPVSWQPFRSSPPEEALCLLCAPAAISFLRCVRVLCNEALEGEFSLWKHRRYCQKFIGHPLK